MIHVLDEDKVRYCAEHLHEDSLRKFIVDLALLVNAWEVRVRTGFATKPISLDSWVATAEVDATPGLRDKLVARKAKLDKVTKP